MMTPGEIRQVQQALNKLMNAGLAVDGDYGPATIKAVKDFQKQNMLKVDGVYGPITAVALDRALSARGFGFLEWIKGMFAR